MSLRDLFLFSLLLVLVVMALRRPFIGALAWVLFGVMNPHRLTWGAAYDFPFAAVIAIVTVLGLLVTKEHKSPKGGAAAVVLIMFFLWNCITTVFAFQPDPAWAYLARVSKIYLMTFVLILVMHTRRDVLLLIGTLAVSLGFYGTKGGIFVIATGGAYMVNGPPDSVMEGNNSLGVGLSMLVPLLYFLMQQTTQRWHRYALVTAMLLCAASVLGAYSRGAMLSVAAMSVVLWLRGRNKVAVLVLVGALVTLAIPAMPAHWFAKMDTLRTYDEDNSAMFRLYAWETAYNIAKDQFPLAGGFEWESPAASQKYSPLPTLVLVAHSIYFMVIGSQGFIGLALYLAFWSLVWRQCGWLRRHGRAAPDRLWAFQLGSMTQVSLVGYAVGGAFLDLAFWDVPYYLFATVAAARFAAEHEPLASQRPTTAAAAPALVGRAGATGPVGRATLGAARPALLAARHRRCRRCLRSSGRIFSGTLPGGRQWCHFYHSSQQFRSATKERNNGLAHSGGKACNQRPDTFWRPR